MFSSPKTKLCTVYEPREVLQAEEKGLEDAIAENP